MTQSIVGLVVRVGINDNFFFFRNTSYQVIENQNINRNPKIIFRNM